MKRNHIWIVEFQERPGKWVTTASDPQLAFHTKIKADWAVQGYNRADRGNYRVRKYVREEE